MKANEVPERIYINPNPEHRTWLIGKGDISFIEYVKEDAFIEKAVSYLNSELYDWVQTTNPNQRSFANVILKRDFIEDFINYMKGE